MPQKQILIAVTFLLLILCGCFSHDGELSSRNYYGADKCKFVLDQLYFGLKKPNGEVSEEEWNKFVDNVITQRFPNGFNVIDSYGQWRDNNGQIIKENTKLVQIAHENQLESNNNIKEIIKEYTEKFDQEAVLRITSCPHVNF
jgi:hypothetical protein